MMRFRNLALAAAAVAGACGLAGAAAAAIQNSHVLTVELPDGTTAHIRYFGDTPPEVRVEPGHAFAPLAVFAPWPPFADAQFARMQQAMAEMDRRAADMFAETERLMRAPPFGSDFVQASLGGVPEGASGYSIVSTVTSNGVCTRSVEYRATGLGRPQVVRRTSGDCGGAAAAHDGLSPGAPQDAPRLTAVAYQPAA